MQDTIESRLDKALLAIYDVRMLCFDILKELKRLKLNEQSHQPDSLGKTPKQI